VHIAIPFIIESSPSAHHRHPHDRIQHLIALADGSRSRTLTLRETSRATTTVDWIERYQSDGRARKNTLERPQEQQKLCEREEQ
jgi:hypothetical protein